MQQYQLHHYQRYRCENVAPLFYLSIFLYKNDISTMIIIVKTDQKQMKGNVVKTIERLALSDWPYLQ